MSANNVDLPTPSGPITPTILRAGTSIVTLSSAIVAPYRCETASSRATTGARHCGSLTCRSSGHAVAAFVRTMPSPRTPVFTRRLYCLRTSASNWSLTRNISFSRSSWVSTVFGVNCASAATKLTEAGTTYWGTGSRMMRASPPMLKSAGGRRRQEDGHVNVLQVEDGQDLPASGDHFAVARELILHAPGPGRDQNQVVQNCLDPLDLRLRALDSGVGLVTLGYRTTDARLRHLRNCGGADRRSVA